MDLDRKDFNGACHCGTIRFRVHLSEGLRSARRCSCSMCRMRGAVAVTAKVGDLEITAGADALTLYQFNTLVARHYFCSQCGIYTHHQRRSNPSQLGVNVACLEGVSPFDFSAVTVNDGVNHPTDGKAGSGLAGVLRFEPASDR
ncbi:GFA family protein [Tianweitania sp. BSSL-BM11]|uniref:GFA family protein n=1 Tax=Tianweitania aestuarii TaxID=2814886 RepID=A0ABS5RZ55_9HYPH|nr:GFA family protein [Tianweitania aestuarii]MBS9722334.1 GFA family protein [Tianweitania aestuarii]